MPPSFSPLHEDHIALIEKLASEGANIDAIARRLHVAAANLRKWAESDPRIVMALANGRERLQQKGDQARRDVIKKELNYFNPTPEEIAEVFELARLNWPEQKMADRFKVPIYVWQEAKKKFPALDEAVKKGREQSGGKAILDKIRGWVPLPSELERIRKLAGEGCTPPQISVALGLPATALENRMHDLPELQMAYEDGLAECEMKVSGRLFDMAMSGNTAAAIFWLKARRKDYWSEKPPTAAEAAEKGRRSAKVYMPAELEETAFEKKAEKARKLRVVQGDKK